MTKQVTPETEYAQFLHEQIVAIWSDDYPEGTADDRMERAIVDLIEQGLKRYAASRSTPKPQPDKRNEGTCDDCGSKYPTPWFAANELWNRVMPDRVGMLCPDCFIWRAKSAGVETTGWEIREERLAPTPAEEVDYETIALNLASAANARAEQPDTDEGLTTEELAARWPGNVSRRENRPKASYVGAPAIFALETACRQINEAFGGYGCYLVGSSLERADWRDVDVRFIMSDDDFAKLFPDAGQYWEQDARWLLLTVSISERLSKVTGLPIDFQIQPQTHANERHKGTRSSIGLKISTGKSPEGR